MDAALRIFKNFTNGKMLFIGSTTVAVLGLGVAGWQYRIQQDRAAVETFQPVSSLGASSGTANIPPLVHSDAQPPANSSLPASANTPTMPSVAAHGQTANLKPPASHGPDAANDRAMWVWWGDAIAGNADKENQLFAFAAAKGITTLYFDSQGLITSNPDALKSFISAARAHSLNVAMLFGEADWVPASGHAAAVSYMQKAVALANAMPASSRPFGVHFDVEPGDISGQAMDYLDLLDELRAAKGPLDFTVDTKMAFDYSMVTRNGSSKELTKWVIDATDGVALMDYRNAAALPGDTIIDHALMTLSYAASAGKHATIGLEVSCDVDYVDKISFCNEGNAALESEISKAKSQYIGNVSFAGIAIEHYNSYVTLKP